MRKHQDKTSRRVFFWGVIIGCFGLSPLPVISTSVAPMEEQLTTSIEYLRPLMGHMQKKHTLTLSYRLADLLNRKEDRISFSRFADALDDITGLISESVPCIKKEDSKEGWQALFAALYTLTSVKRASCILKFKDEQVAGRVLDVSRKIDMFLEWLFEQLDGQQKRSVNFDPSGLGIRQILLANIIPALELSLNKLCTATSNVDVIDTQFDVIDLQNQTLDSKVDVVDGELETVQSDITTILSKVCTIDSKVDVIDDEVAVVESLVDALGQTFVTIDSKVDIIDEEVVTLDSKVDVIDDTADITESKVCVVESKVDVMPMLTKTDSVDTIESKVCVTLSKLCDLDATVVDIESELDQIMTELGVIKSLVITLTNC